MFSRSEKAHLVMNLGYYEALNITGRVLLISTRRNIVLGQTIRIKPKTSSSKFKKLSSSIRNQKQKQNAIIILFRFDILETNGIIASSASLNRDMPQSWRWDYWQHSDIKYLRTCRKSKRIQMILPNIMSRI